MIPHTERDQAVFEAVFWTTSGGFVSVLFAICVSVLLCLRKFKSRRFLVASTICTVFFSAPLIYAWILVREHYATVADHSVELTAIMAAYLAVLAISLFGPIVQYFLQTDRIAREDRT